MIIIMITRNYLLSYSILGFFLLGIALVKVDKAGASTI